MQIRKETGSALDCSKLQPNGRTDAPGHVIEDDELTELIRTITTLRHYHHHSHQLRIDVDPILYARLE
eukprot:2235316-Rhodomonas_salina.1